MTVCNVAYFSWLYLGNAI